jgi:hypothetical protein
MNKKRQRDELPSDIVATIFAFVIETIRDAMKLLEVQKAWTLRMICGAMRARNFAIRLTKNRRKDDFSLQNWNAVPCAWKSAFPYIRLQGATKFVTENLREIASEKTRKSYVGVFFVDALSCQNRDWSNLQQDLSRLRTKELELFNGEDLVAATRDIRLHSSVSSLSTFNIAVNSLRFSGHVRDLSFVLGCHYERKLEVRDVFLPNMRHLRLISFDACIAVLFLKHLCFLQTFVLSISSTLQNVTNMKQMLKDHPDTNLRCVRRFASNASMFLVFKHILNQDIRAIRIDKNGADLCASDFERFPRLEMLVLGKENLQNEDRIRNFCPNVVLCHDFQQKNFADMDDWLFWVRWGVSHSGFGD